MNEGDKHASVSETSTESTALVSRTKLDLRKFLPTIDPNDDGDVRRVRRGKFFLSNHEQRTHGSMRRPIFEYWGHGVVVGEMIPAVMVGGEEPDGMWCFAAHNDFDLIPESLDPKDWPEYMRTPTGWVRKDGHRRISDEGTFSNAGPSAPITVDDLLKLTSTLKRLK